MKNEAQFCTVVKNSMIAGFKIPDASGEFTSTSIRCYDGLGLLDINTELIFCPWEAKYLKSLGAFAFSRVEPHQDFYLSEHGKAKSIFPLLIVGIDCGRADKRVFIFDYLDCGHDLYQNRCSIHKKYLEKLPYNKITKGVFKFDNIIHKEDIVKAYDVSTFDEAILSSSNRR